MGKFPEDCRKRQPILGEGQCHTILPCVFICPAVLVGGAVLTREASVVCFVVCFILDRPPLCIQHVSDPEKCTVVLGFGASLFTLGVLLERSQRLGVAA